MEISAASRQASAMAPKMLAETCYCRGLGQNAIQFSEVFGWFCCETEKQ